MDYTTLNSLWAKKKILANENVYNEVNGIPDGLGHLLLTHHHQVYKLHPLLVKGEKEKINIPN